MAYALATVATFAHEMVAGLPLAPGSFLWDADGDFQVRRDPRPSRHHFFVDGLLIRVALTPNFDEAGRPTTLFQIWAELGYLPYTVESPDKRARLLTILKATHGLSHARFVVDDSQRIIALHQEENVGTMTLSDMVEGAVRFLRCARPFARVIGHYL